MSVFKRKDRAGRWQAKLVGPHGRIVSKTFDRRADAVRWHSEQLAARDRGQLIDPRSGKITLGEFYADWASRQVWTRNTADSVDLSMRSVTFGDLPLNRIRRSHVESWIKKLATEGKAPGTIKLRHRHLRGVLRAAVRDKLIPHDPSEGVVLPRQRRREAAMVLPTLEQVRALLVHAELWFRPFIALAAFCGLRAGEIAGLQVGDIDFLKRKIHIRRQIQKPRDGAIEVGLPKCASERSIVLPDELLIMLSQHVKTCESEWLFPPSRYGPPNRTALVHVWEQTCQRAGVTGVTMHSLRHFAASGLIAGGVDVVSVQRVLGHSTPTTTLHVYFHYWAEAEDRTRQATAELMSAVTSPDRPQKRRTTRSRDGTLAR